MSLQDECSDGHFLPDIVTECDISDCQVQPDGRLSVQCVGVRRVHTCGAAEIDGYRVCHVDQIVNDELLPQGDMDGAGDMTTLPDAIVVRRAHKILDGLAVFLCQPSSSAGLHCWQLLFSCVARNCCAASGLTLPQHAKPPRKHHCIKHQAQHPIICEAFGAACTTWPHARAEASRQLRARAKRRDAAGRGRKPAAAQCGAAAPRRAELPTRP